MQVSQSKLIFLKDMWRLNFGEFMRFLPEGLNPFKIQIRFKVDLFSNFIIQNLERFWSFTKKEIFSIWSNLSTCQILNFFELCKYQFIILKIELFKYLKTLWIKRKKIADPTQMNSVESHSAGNLENYWIFLPNPKMECMKAQPYSDRFPRHHISFSYRLPYLPNNMKMTRKYGKMELVFPKILSTIFTPIRGSSGRNTVWYVCC
jgi:hypothetical protein